jgi:hypothetical protein
VDITVQDELDEENDVENVIMRENKDESDSESSTPDITTQAFLYQSC